MRICQHGVSVGLLGFPLPFTFSFPSIWIDSMKWMMRPESSCIRGGGWAGWGAQGCSRVFQSWMMCLWFPWDMVGEIEHLIVRGRKEVTIMTVDEMVSLLGVGAQKQDGPDDNQRWVVKVLCVVSVSGKHWRLPLLSVICIEICISWAIINMCWWSTNVQYTVTGTTSQQHREFVLVTLMNTVCLHQHHLSRPLDQNTGY